MRLPALNENSKSFTTLFLDIRRAQSFLCGSDQPRMEGKFKSKCGCINHDIFSNSVEHIILRKTSLVAHRLSYKSLFEKNLINKRAKNVCSACLAVSKDCSSSNTVCITNSSLENIPEEDETIPEDNTDYSADNYVEILKNIENISNVLQGSYTTLHDILASKVDPISCPSGDIYNTIDNIQKVGICTWRIREGLPVPLGICIYAQQLAILYPSLLHHYNVRRI